MKLLLSGFFLSFGVLWMVLAGIGIHKYQDFFYKIHIASKGPSLGLLMIITGVAIHFGTLLTTLKCFAIAAFVFITVPVASSLVALTGYEKTYGKLEDEEEEVLPT